jgi:3'(2'), 5'-bisphosphate nucleotidase
MDQDRLEKILDFLKQQARSAGKIMQAYYGGDFKVYYKPDNSRVTDVDLEISKMIHEQAPKVFPKIGLYTEESSNRQFVPNQDFFIIDELDGTSFFIENTKGFSHQAAYFSADHGLIIGLVYLPLDDIMLFAIKGKGAFREQNGEIRRLEAPPVKDFKHLHYAHPARYRGSKYRDFYEKMGVQANQLLLTSAYKTLQFVEGELDVSILLKGGMPVWDWAGEKVIVEELGFRYTYLDGREMHFGQVPVPRETGYLICPAPLQATMIQHIQQTLSSSTSAA